MGFIEETGAAQYYRDAKILTIYEGTTAIQANDLVGRKTSRDGGQTGKMPSAVQIEATEADLIKPGTADALAMAKRLGPHAKHSWMWWTLLRATPRPAPTRCLPAACLT
jgi:hypothetical protein